MYNFSLFIHFTLHSGGVEFSLFATDSDSEAGDSVYGDEMSPLDDLEDSKFRPCSITTDVEKMQFDISNILPMICFIDAWLEVVKTNDHICDYQEKDVG